MVVKIFVHGFYETGDVRVFWAVPCAVGTFWVRRVCKGSGWQTSGLWLLVLRHWWWWWWRRRRRRLLLQREVDMMLAAVLALFCTFGLSACCVTLGHCIWVEDQGACFASRLCRSPARGTGAVFGSDIVHVSWVSTAVTVVWVDGWATLLMTPCTRSGWWATCATEPPTVTGVTAECVQAEKGQSAVSKQRPTKP